MTSAGLRVLVVDDVAPALDEMCELLREAPGVASVEEASDALTALRLIPTTVPDVVFLDFLMPKMSGLDALQAIRQSGGTAPVVLLTAISDRSVKSVGSGAAPDAILEKPPRRKSVEKVLQQTVRGG